MLTRRLFLAILAVAIAVPASYAATTTGAKKRVLTGGLGVPDGDLMIGVGKKFYEVHGNTLHMTLWHLASDSLMAGKDRRVTLGGTASQGPFMAQFDLDWVQATATKDLVVRVYPSDSAGLNTFTRVRKGDRVRIMNLEKGYFQIQHVGGPIDAYAFTKPQHLEIGEVVKH